MYTVYTVIFFYYRADLCYNAMHEIIHRIHERGESPCYQEKKQEKRNTNGIGHKHLAAVGVGLSCLVVVLAALLLMQRHEASSQLLTPPPAGLSATTAETPHS